MLSNWNLEIKKYENEEDEIFDTLAAIITPREEVDTLLIAIAPLEQPRQTISMPPRTVEFAEQLWVDSFDRSARTILERGSLQCGYLAIVRVDRSGSSD